jgi:hypothetical protein
MPVKSVFVVLVFVCPLSLSSAAKILVRICKASRAENHAIIGADAAGGALCHAIA